MSISRNLSFKKITYLFSRLVVLFITSLSLLFIFEYLLYTSYNAKLQILGDSRVSADGYEGEAWVKDYFSEFLRTKARWEPYTYWRLESINGKYINVDLNGLRKTFKSQKASKPMKIFFFGGSTMWGTGSRDEFTIPSFFVKNIQGKTNVEATNFGESGWVSTQSLIELTKQLKNGNIPDAVIFYDGVNDVYSAHQNLEDGIPQNEVKRRREFNLLQTEPMLNKVQRLAAPLLEGSWLVEMVKIFKRKNSSLFMQSNDYPKKLPEKIINGYLQNIKILKALGREYGFKTYAFWQPVIYSKSKLTKYENSQKEVMGRQLQSLYEESYSFLKSNKNNSVIDISDTFENIDAPVYIDFCHITESGNDMVSKEIIKYVIRGL